MTNTNKGLRRLLAGTGAFALALAGTFATAQLASADPGPDQVAPTKTGSLTIYKYAGGPLGEDESLDDRDTLEGVEFTATRVGIVGGTEDDPTCTVIDLAKITDWTGIEALFDQLRAAADVPGQIYTLTWRGTAYQVIWRHEDAPALDAEGVTDYYDPEPTDLVVPTLKFVRIA